MVELNRIKEHVKVLNTGDDESRWESVRTLKTAETQEWAALSADVLKPLIDALRHQLPKRAEGAGAKLPTHLRRDVAHILGKIGARAVVSVPQLIDLLKESEPLAVRETAVTALGEIGDVAKEAVPSLLAVLTAECRVTLAVRVARALGDIGVSDAKVRAALAELWRSTAAASQTQIQIAPALCKLKVDAPGMLPSLVNAAVAGQNVGLRTAAVEALQWCSKNQVGVVPALLAASHDDDETVQALGVAGLERIGVVPAKAIQICSRQLKDCHHAETALRRTGAPVVNTLVKALDDDEPIVREKAAKILSFIGEPAIDAADALNEILADKFSEVRLSAAKALWNITKKPDVVVPTLAGLLTGKIWPAPTDGEDRRRFLQSVIEALGRIGPAAQGAVPSLITKSRDDNRLVRESAARTLRQIDPNAAVKAGV